MFVSFVFLLHSLRINMHRLNSAVIIAVVDPVDADTATHSLPVYVDLRVRFALRAFSD